MYRTCGVESNSTGLRDCANAADDRSMTDMIDGMSLYIVRILMQNSRAEFFTGYECGKSGFREEEILFPTPVKG